MYLTCKRNIVFKNIFLDKTNKVLLEKLLSSILNTNIRIKNYGALELPNDNNKTKRKILDLLLETDNSIIDVESNANPEYYSHERNMAYESNLYTNYTLKNEDYDKDYKIIQINLSYGINSNISIDKYNFQSKNNKYIENLIGYEVNMDYFKKIWYSLDTEAITKYRYIIMLDLDDYELEELYEMTKDEEVRKFMEKMKKLNSDEKFMRYANSEEENELDKRFAYINGREKGIDEGKKESQEIIAKNMLDAKMNVDTISKLTGLTTAQIKSL